MSTGTIKLVTGPTIEPIKLDEAKLHLRVDATFEEDYLIYALIQVAREYTEKVTGLALCSQVVDEFYNSWQYEFELSRNLAVTPALSVNYTDTTGTETVLAPANYIVNDHGDIPSVVLAYGYSWPQVTLYPASPIRIRYTTGFGTGTSTVPRTLYLAMLLLIGHWFKFREAVLAGAFDKLASEIPLGFSALITQDRRR